VRCIMRPACRELPQLRAQIKQMEEEKERLGDKVQKAAAQAAGMQLLVQLGTA